ncbi:GNAT family N-acetyltransferase [Sphingomonas sanguinis]|jgi:ribosomal-protein-alanine N-acetyltransferase|uniref:GNAT family N-acetyltransferase n=1 Tax=Sphingomonas sp. LC-1 TaxID=3110957 RepID=UPI0021BA864E|nr:GNAT family N-acetyltransferase [Sphingomonas sp. LC-1]MCT8001922.1 GNAT family N-acetyltransferase [Sphingomonas sp. LC-1]
MASISLTLRDGDARDAGVIEQVMAAAFDPIWGEAWTRAQLLGVMTMPGIHLLIAEAGGEAAGFALTRSVMDEAELLLLGVAPDYRRNGIASALVEMVVADCAARGVVTLHLEVRANNPAVLFYTAHGFAKCGERRNYYKGADGRHYDAHTYTRAIG